MNTLELSVDSSQLRGKGKRALVPFGRALDRFVQRAAGEFVREEKLQAPKAFSTLATSIAMQRNGLADYSAVVAARHGRWINDGTEPHMPPLKPLMEWLRLTKRVSDPRELHKRARGLQRFIARHGVTANPFVQRTRDKMEDRVRDLIRQGVDAGVKEAFQ